MELLDRETFLEWMERIMKRFDDLKQTAPDIPQRPMIDGEPLLDNQEVCMMLQVSKRTLQRMRSTDRISYKMIYGRCYYDLHDIEKAIRNKSLYCNPQNLKELRHNFELKSRRIKDGTIG